MRQIDGWIALGGPMGAGFRERSRWLMAKLGGAPLMDYLWPRRSPADAFKVVLEPLGGKHIQISVTNQSPERATFCIYHTPFEGIANHIFKVECDGEPVPYAGMMRKRAAPGRAHYIHLAPGAVHGPVVVDLAQHYALGPGRYRVSFRGSAISGLPDSEGIWVGEDRPGDSS